jgi:uncharacterized phage-associated protein
MYNSFQIANYFLLLGQKTGIEITPMKIIKLCYIAHGWHLGFTSKPLLDETIYAWKYGPVIDTLYDRFKEYGSSPIRTLYSPDWNGGNYPLPDQSSSINSFLDSIWKAYGKYDGITLSAMTHQKDTPWYKVWHEEGGRNKRQIPIPNNYIEEHYKQKIEGVKTARSISHSTELQLIN